MDAQNESLCSDWSIIERRRCWMNFFEFISLSWQTKGLQLHPLTCYIEIIIIIILIKFIIINCKRGLLYL